jgi:RNA polymerase sigma-70 factor, ECF subfamily
MIETDPWRLEERQRMPSNHLHQIDGASRVHWDATIEAARAGDLEVLGLAVQAFRQYLMLIARQETEGDLRAKAGASDLVQETFMVAQKRFGSFSGRDEGELKAWLRAILKHRLAKFRSRFRGTAMRQAARELDLGRGRAIESIPGELTSPSGVAQRLEERAALDHALSRLPDHHRKAVLLRHEQGLRFEQIAAELGTTTEGARKYWARGVERLRRELGPVFS